MSAVLSRVPVLVSLFAIFQNTFFPSFLFATNTSTVRIEDPKGFENTILDRVYDCISYNQELQCKEEIFEVLKSLREKNFYVQTGSDDFRSKFVHSQAAFEHVMACCQALGDITALAGVIHTPTPATPLCTEPESVAEGLLDQSIQWDRDKLLTVLSRAQIVREYLMKGGSLHIAYPKGGLDKRTPEQQGIYKKALADHPARLFDAVLGSDPIHEDMIGATYLFKNKSGQTFAFSIKARQANDAQAESEWGLWFGEVSHPAVKERVDLIFDYLKACHGPDLREARYLDEKA